MSVVIIEGSEAFLCEEVVSGIASEHPTKTLMRIDAKENFEGLTQALSGGGFFPTSNLVVVTNASKSDQKWLSHYCESPDPNHTLVLIDKPGKKAKWYTSLKRDKTIECQSLKPWEYKDWIVSYCRSKGYNIDARLAEALHTNVGDDLFALSNEIEKIILRLGGKRHTILSGDITSVLVSHQVLSPAKIVSAWAAQQNDIALKYLMVFFYQSSDPYAALGVVGMFLMTLERMITFTSYKKGGFSKRDICEIMSISPYVYDQIDRDTFSWTLKQLRQAYSDMCRIEAEAKRGKSLSNLLTCYLGGNQS